MYSFELKLFLYLLYDIRTVTEQSSDSLTSCSKFNLSFIDTINVHHCETEKIKKMFRYRLRKLFTTEVSLYMNIGYIKCKCQETRWRIVMIIKNIILYRSRTYFYKYYVEIYVEYVFSNRQKYYTSQLLLLYIWWRVTWIQDGFVS